MPHFNLLSERLVRITRASGPPDELTLPDTFAALMRDEVAAFPGLRPHQRHAWHAFLVQIGALALVMAERSEPPEDEATWARLLRGLTPDHPDDEPWCLVASPDQPALLQPPLPSNGIAELKSLIETPDALDMLVTAKNHDLKQEVMGEAALDNWLFALITLQTMEGFLGAGNYGISRMNGGFANRPALGIASPGGPGAHVRRDITRLIALRPEMLRSGVYAPEGGLGLVWLRAWDGATSLKPSDLDPYYVEICRRVRLTQVGNRLQARAGGSKVARIAPIPGGVTGDPWAPIVLDKDGSQKVLTVDAAGFSYRRMVRLMFERESIRPAPLQEIAESDAAEGLSLIARALVRGQGKTEGYHERRVMLSKKVRQSFMRSKTSDPVAEAAQRRIALAGEIQNRVLKPALLALFENGPDKIDFRDDGAERRARAFLDRFDEFVDTDFFPRLWDEFEAENGLAERTRWVNDLLEAARGLLAEADQGASKAVQRRYRARAYAESVFWATSRKNPHIAPHLPERDRNAAA